MAMTPLRRRTRAASSKTLLDESSSRERTLAMVLSSAAQCYLTDWPGARGWQYPIGSDALEMQSPQPPCRPVRGQSPAEGQGPSPPLPFHRPSRLLALPVSCRHGTPGRHRKVDSLATHESAALPGTILDSQLKSTPRTRMIACATRLRVDPGGARPLLPSHPLNRFSAGGGPPVSRGRRSGH